MMLLSPLMLFAAIQRHTRSMLAADARLMSMRALYARCAFYDYAAMLLAAAAYAAITHYFRR